MSQRNVLVVGASLAGPVTAFWLSKAGYRVTVVERAPQFRLGGNGVDVREQAIEVAERMGIMDDVRAATTAMKGLKFLDRRGRQRGSIDMQAVQRDGGGAVEILRTDLAQIFYRSTLERVEYRFGVAPRRIEQNSDGVDVEFESGTTERFDFVVGADGAHSGVRRLVFGPETEFLRFKQHFVAAASVHTTLGEPLWSTLYTEPGRGISSVQPSSGTPKAYFIFRHEQEVAYEHYRDLDQQQTLLRQGFAGVQGLAGRLVDEAASDPDLYFDALSQVKMPRWSTGRVVLVGDAAYCASPLSGSGALLAMVGAYRLSGELVEAGGEVTQAFGAYEAGMRPLVDGKQGSLFTGVLAPKTRAALISRNLLVRLPIGALALKMKSKPVPPLPAYAFEAASS